MRCSILITTTLFFAGATSLSPQDPVTVNPKMVKVEFENDRIRVLRVHYDPHQTLAMHSHPARLVILLTDNDGRSVLPDGTSQETHGKSGDIRWREAGTHMVENLSSEPMENIEIELKNANSPGVAITPPTNASDSEKLQEPVPVEKEPHHHPVFQNQFVRVLDVLMPPGQASLFHTHSHDNVAVRLGGDKAQAQSVGKEWDPVSEVQIGQVSFASAASQPYTHRVRSAGKLAFHVIDVEIFP